MRTYYAMTSCAPLVAVAAASADQSRRLRMTVSRRASVCTVAAAFSIASVVAESIPPLRRITARFIEQTNPKSEYSKLWPQSVV